MRRKSLGFTLIELMIALAIVGILSAVAFPAYKYQIRKGTRAAAEAAIMDIANREQQYLLANRKYAAQTSTDTSLETDTGYSLPTDVSKHYTYQVTTNAAGTYPNTFLITFTPKSTSLMNGDGNLTLDHTGAKSSNW